jgi:hypothetical protein
MAIRTPENLAITKLPKWAQEYIHDLQTSVHNGESALKEYLDSQTKSPFSVMDSVCMTENKITTRYIQANNISCTNAGVSVTMIPRDNGVDILFESEHRAAGEAAIIPHAANAIRICRAVLGERRSA